MMTYQRSGQSSRFPVPRLVSFPNHDDNPDQSDSVGWGSKSASFELIELSAWGSNRMDSSGCSNLTAKMGCNNNGQGEAALEDIR